MPESPIASSSIEKRQSKIENLLCRPDDQRLREYKYRCAQTIVFGLPVLALEFYGYALGPADAERWVPILQALLCGWIVYVAAAGMLFEGLLLLRRRLSLDLLVALAATAMYLFSVISVCHVLTTGRLWYRPLLFHVVVLLLAAWTWIQWLRFARKLRNESHRHHESRGGP